MSIVSSQYIADEHAQVDGRRYVTEIHTDSEGVEHRVSYLAPVNADYAAIASARSIALAEQLAEQEAGEVLSG